MTSDMFSCYLNDRTVTLRLKRREVTKILRICLVCAEYGDDILDIHDKVKAILDEFDRKHGDMAK